MLQIIKNKWLSCNAEMQRLIVSFALPLIVFSCILVLSTQSQQTGELVLLVSYVLIACCIFVVTKIAEVYLAWLRTAPKGVPISGQLAIHDLVIELKSKAVWMRRVANGVLIMVMFCLLGGAYFFSQAESRATINLTELETLKTAVERALEKSHNAKAILERTLSASASVLDSEKKPALAKLSFLQSEYEAAKVELKERQVLLDALFAKKIDAPTSESLTIYLTSVLSTKIGTVLFLLFLVQILVGLHRYLMRLAAFYDSRAYMLQLTPNASDLNISVIQEIFVTDAIDFGKQPKPAAEIVADGVTDVVKSIVKRKPPAKKKANLAEE